MKQRDCLYAIIIIASLLLASCVADDPQVPSVSDARPLVVYASIDGSLNVSTRAKITETGDLWSYAEEFEENDAMGLYSPTGNWQDNNGKGPFINMDLIYTGTRFKAQDGTDFSPTNMNGSKIFMYFPYCETMENPGFELRQKPRTNDDSDDGESPLYNKRCADILTSNEINLQGASEALYGVFYHAFGELIIMRGEGFDSPPEGKERITVVLDNPYTHLQVKGYDEENNWKGTPELVFHENTGLTTEQARRWNAWKGGNYHVSGKGGDGEPAWYVIVPTIGCQSNMGMKREGIRSTVDYIELYDNEGYLYRISSLPLSNGDSKYVDAGWRYPLRIIMKDLVPTVNPSPIIPWENDNLTTKRERGISQSTFKSWIQAYNTYLTNPTDPGNISALLSYGDTYVNEGETSRSWHFYLLSDIDLTSFQTGSVQDKLEMESDGRSYILPELCDTLDGISTNFVNGKFTNYTVKGLSNTFVRTMKDKGVIQNIDFISPSVQNDKNSANPAGIIVESMENVSVINCKVERGFLFNPGGLAGMVAGTMTGGKVENCFLSGTLVADGTAPGDAKYIVGETKGECSFTGTKVSVAVTEEEP